MSSRKEQEGGQPRVPLERAVALRFNHFSEFIDEVSADISAGGMFIRTRALYPVASIFEFRLQPSGDLPLISGKAQVAWVRSRDENEDRQAGMGARYVELDENSRRAIQQIVDEHESPGEQCDESTADVVIEDSRRTVIEGHLKNLKLPGLAREYAGLISQARDHAWDYEDLLRELLEAEVVSRRKSLAARRLRAAQFPEHKTLEQIDWQVLEGVSRPRIAQLARCGYLDRAEDIVITGPIGTGKTHLAIALGIEATRQRYRVLFRRTADLVRELIEARDERELLRFQRRLERVDLLICDELGFVSLDKAEAEILFHVLAGRCGQRSTMVTTDLAFSEWGNALSDEKLAAALVDRLSRSCHVLMPTGRAYGGPASDEPTA